MGSQHKRACHCRSDCKARISKRTYHLIEVWLKDVVGLKLRLEVWAHSAEEYTNMGALSSPPRRANMLTIAVLDGGGGGHIGIGIFQGAVILYR